MTYYFQRDYEVHDTLLSHEATGEDLWQWMGRNWSHDRKGRTHDKEWQM